MASAHSRMHCGEFRTTYQKDTTIFPTPLARKVAVGGVILLLLAPQTLEAGLRQQIVELAPAWMVFEGPETDRLRSRFPEPVHGATFIVDPEGNIMERFEPDADATGIRKDLRRLLTWTVRE